MTINIENAKVTIETFAGQREVVSIDGNWIKDSQGRSWLVSNEIAMSIQSHINMRDAMKEAEVNTSKLWDTAVQS